MKIEYVENYIVVSFQGYVMYDDAAQRAGIDQHFPDWEKEHCLENFKVFYMCSQQKRPVFNETVPDTVLKLKVFAPNRLAAEKAAEIQNTRTGSGASGTFYQWIE